MQENSLVQHNIYLAIDSPEFVDLSRVYAVSKNRGNGYSYVLMLKMASQVIAERPNDGRQVLWHYVFQPSEVPLITTCRYWSYGDRKNLCIWRGISLRFFSYYVIIHIIAR